MVPITQCVIHKTSCSIQIGLEILHCNRYKVAYPIGNHRTLLRWAEDGSFKIRSPFTAGGRVQFTVATSFSE